MGLLLVLGFTSFAGACGGDPPVLLVDLKTDLVSGVEFDAIELQIIAADGTARVLDVAAERGTVYAAGLRIAEVEGLGKGALSLEVELRRGGLIVAERPVIVAFDGTRAVTILIARSCINVMCPEPGGDANLSACYGGRCADARCSGEDLSFCGAPECASAADCPPPSGACAMARCEDGVCLETSAADACGAGLFCDPAAGCVPEPVVGGPDAGTDAGDAGPADTGAPDTGAPDTGIVAMDEICNGLDDDLDTRIDEAPPGGIATACFALGPANDPASRQNMSNENLRVSLYTFPVRTDVAAIHAHLESTGASAMPVRAVIYVPDVGCGGTICGNLQGISDEVVVGAGEPGRWVRFAFAPTVNLAAGDYYLGIQNGAPGDVYTYGYDSTMGQRWNWGSPYVASPPSTFSLSSPTTGEISLIVERTP